METFFHSRKQRLLNHNFILSNDIIFLVFWQKNLKNRAGKTFYGSILFNTHSAANLLQFVILKNCIFSSKNSSIFPRKPKIWEFFRNLTVSIAFYDKFVTLWWKKVACSETWTNIVNAIGKHRIKNTRLDWTILLPFIITKREQIIKQKTAQSWEKLKNVCEARNLAQEL